MIPRDNLKKRNIFWILGSSRSGKTTVSNQLKERYPVYIYHLDEELFMKLWPKLVCEKKHPNIAKVISFNQDYHRYYNRDMGEIVSETFAAFEESWPMVFDDLDNLEVDGTIVVEGGSVFPSMIQEYADPNRVISLIPTRSFQKQVFLAGMRLEPGEEPKNERQLFTQYEDVDFLVEQRIDHHEAIARRARTESRNLGYKYIEVRSKEDLKGNYEKVVAHFGW
jgi:hypothetical protein